MNDFDNSYVNFYSNHKSTPQFVSDIAFSISPTPISNIHSDPHDNRNYRLIWRDHGENDSAKTIIEPVRYPLSYGEKKAGLSFGDDHINCYKIFPVYKECKVIPRFIFISEYLKTRHWKHPTCNSNIIVSDSWHECK